jgi:uncharacterized membrane protein YbhN (UPF0104 family)
MTTVLLDAPAVSVIAAAPVQPAVVDADTARPSGAAIGAAPAGSARGRSQLWPWLAAALVAGVAVVLALRLHPAELAAALAHAHPGQLAAAIGWTALSLVAAAYNISAFATVRLRARDSILGQLAVSGLRIVTPSAVSTPLVVTRLLTRAGASTSAALTTVAAAQLVQLLATFAVVAALAALAGSAGPTLPSADLVILVAAALVLAAGAVLALASRMPRIAAALSSAGRSATELARHARANPLRMGVGVGASAALTLTHILAFAACVHAAGGQASLLTLAAIYLGAASAGSLVPTPGGIGAVETALIVGLTGSGVPLPVATAATALSRLVSVWLPAGPGWFAAARLRRAGLL